MKINPTTAALGRAVLSLESEAGKNHIEASLARSNGDDEHARFYLSRELQARADAKALAYLMEQTTDHHFTVEERWHPAEPPIGAIKRGAKTIFDFVREKGEEPL